MSSSLTQIDDCDDVVILKKRIADSGKARLALQGIVDALATLPALEKFVPAALRIIAGAFEAADCGYYEHHRDGLVRLRYWFVDDKVFGPEQISAFGDDHRYAAIRPLETGIEIPDSYLGFPFRTRTTPLVLNHGWDQFEDAWEKLKTHFGWNMVLNVPLIIDGDATGALVINRRTHTEYSRPEIEFAAQLAQQLALAVQVDRLAEQARQTAVFQAREIATRIQLEEMAKTDLALQHLTDALATMPDLSTFIPAALQIIATTFAAKDCAYYEHRRGDLIHLRYWFYENRVLSPDDIAALTYEDIGFMRQLAVDGFTVPDDYLGVPFRERTRASVVDHTLRDPPSEFDNNSNERGWHLELNVPLVVAGEADGALIICHSIDAPFLPREIALAERLGQQLALAIEASRLSGADKDAAIANERERAARDRVTELSHHADALKQTIDSLVDESDFLGSIGRILIIASKLLQAPVTEYWTDDGISTTTLMLTSRDLIVCDGAGDSNDRRTLGIPFSPKTSAQGDLRQRAAPILFDMHDDHFRLHAETFGMNVDDWCAARGVRKLVIIPLSRADLTFGSLCVYLPGDRQLDQSQLDLACSLGQQVALAARMTDLAETSRLTALSKEREDAANSRAADLSKANDLLRSTLDQLSDEPDYITFPRSILRIAMEQSGARDGVIFVFDKDTDTLCGSDYLASPDAPLASRITFYRPFPTTSAPCWAKAIATKGPVAYDVDADADMLLPGAAQWHQERGNRCVVIIPMFINAQPYGYFGVGLPRAPTLVSQVDLELMQALTQQSSLAIQLTRLAEASKQAALAREREKAAEDRANEFANANKVLRSTLDKLSKETDLHSFPRTILQEAMTHTGAHDGLILTYDALTDRLNYAEYVNAQGQTPETPLFPSFAASEMRAWHDMITKRVPVVFDVDDDFAKALPGGAARYRQHYSRSILAVAMFVDSQPYGYFGILLDEQAADVSNVKKGLIQALAQQATLAVQLMRLAQASQHNAIMVERQQVVVQERANMAREIHDKLAQGYAAILIQQHMMRRSLIRDHVSAAIADPLLEHLDVIERLSKQNLADARLTMDDLRLDPFGPGNFAAALRLCIKQLSQDPEFVLSLQIEDGLPPLRRYVEIELCRIVLEAVTNARKHARCELVRVTVAHTAGELTIAIRDEGIGFDTRVIGPSFGISSMEERAARAGARIGIVSQTGWGTEVKIVLKP